MHSSVHADAATKAAQLCTHRALLSVQQKRWPVIFFGEMVFEAKFGKGSNRAYMTPVLLFTHATAPGMSA